MQRIRLRVLSAAALAAAAFAVASPALADAALAQAKMCTGCHGIDKKIVGPAYKDVAAKYAGKPGAEAQLTQSILQGSKGTWGTAVMPPNANVTADEAAKLAKWVLSLK